jgi:hypothetical protein
MANKLKITIIRGMKSFRFLSTIKQQFSKFRDHFSDFRLITANLVVVIKMVFFGVLFAEIIHFSQFTAEQLNRTLVNFGHDWWIIFLGSVGIIMTLAYALARGIWGDLKKIFKSYRLDVLIALCFGISIDITWGGFLTGWYEALTVALTFQQLLIIILTPFIIATLVIFRSISWKKKEVDSGFLPDKELEERENDLLNLVEKANRFAGRVFNNGASESFVFGVDAPWGIGKSSFINFCK